MILSAILSLALSLANKKIPLFAEKGLQDQLKFLNRHSLDVELISKIVSECFRPTLLDKIHKDLANSKFSFSIDNATMLGKSLYAIESKIFKRR